MDDATSQILDDQTRENLTKWLQPAYGDETHEEIQRLLSENIDKVIDAFHTTLPFGTGGLRGIVGIGSNRMNKYTIGALVQGLANYLKRMLMNEKNISVLIGYDSRHHSRFFAEEAALILAGNNIQVLIFQDLRPTPLVSFGCRLKQCHAALMITASHNPKEYNGCKVYWADGAQVTAPHDKNIIDEAKKIVDIQMIKHAASLENSKIVIIAKDLDEAYVDASRLSQSYRDEALRHGSEISIVYSSLHGTGITLLPQVLSRWGFTNIAFVDSQIVPNGDFPTVAYPNPEDPKALELGIEKLLQTQGDLLIVTDPDGDRVGAAVLHHGKAEIIDGNQLAVLLLNHICKALTSRNKMGANAAFIKSIATTEMFHAICNYYQKPCVNVLPGFKYITEKIRSWESLATGRQFIFGAEESCGYLYGTSVREKDGLIASAIVAEMALHAKLAGKTLIDDLNDLYTQFGVYHEQVYTLTYDDSKKGKMEIFEKMLKLHRLPPSEIGSIKVASIQDFERSYAYNFLEHQSSALSYPKANIVVFWLVDGSKLLIRPSGTEPKLKIYCEVKVTDIKSIEDAKNKAKRLAEHFIASILSYLE